MGFLKKITRPISKALDKIVPNEVKPFLPYLAAVAPYMLPAGAGLGGSTKVYFQSYASKSFVVRWFKSWFSISTRRK
jgi:hypothetical protein